jgi:hypothetical protein
MAEAAQTAIAAEVIAKALERLKRQALAKDLTRLAYLIGMAIAEARKHQG